MTKRKGISKSRYMLGILAAISLIAGGCGDARLNEPQSGTEAGNQEGGAITNTGGTVDLSHVGQVTTLDINDQFTERDRKTDYIESECTVISLNKTTADTEDSNVKIKDGVIQITQKGSYIIRGSLTDGYLIIDVPEEDKVQLILDGMDISCSGMAPVYIKQADKVFITLAADSENNLRNTDSFTAIDANNVDGAIFSKCDLTLNGTGKLTVSSEEGHGIVSKDDLVITGGEYEITSGDHGISGKDSIRIADGVINITCEEDGLHSGNDEDPEKGYVYVGGGDIDISAGDDGIHGESKAVIGGGTILIGKSNEGIEGAVIEIAGGDITVTSEDDGLNASDEGYILISEGTIAVDASGDGMDSNGSLYMTGGSVTVSGPENSGNGALDYNVTAQITGGTIVAAGAAGMDQNFSDGTQVCIRVTSSAFHSGGEEVVLKDSQGQVLLSYTPAKKYNSVILSSPKLKVGETYTISMGSENQEITPDQLIYGGSSGGMGGPGKGGMGGPGRGGMGGPGKGGMGGPGKGSMDFPEGEGGDWPGQRPDGPAPKPDQNSEAMQ